MQTETTKTDNISGQKPGLDSEEDRAVDEAIDALASRFYGQLEQERQLFKDNSIISNILLSLERRLFVAKAEVEKQFAKGLY